MVLILLMPSIVKLEHHHAHYVYTSKNEKHFLTFHEKCPVCSFEFSVFIPDKAEAAGSKTELTFQYNISNYTFHYSDLSKFSFLLRAPPSRTNIS
jgi:hypothetical protein